MRYVIVSEVRGKARELNHIIRKEVFVRFGARSSTLPAHFTIKAPFEYSDSIEDLKTALNDFTKREITRPYQIKGYDHFERRVIYMDVMMSREGKEVHDRLVDVLQSFPYIQFDDKEGKDKIFHVTIASKRLGPIYDQVWEYVHQYPCDFPCAFDNVSLYRWEKNAWGLEEMYELGGKTK